MCNWHWRLSVGLLLTIAVSCTSEVNQLAENLATCCHHAQQPSSNHSWFQSVCGASQLQRHAGVTTHNRVPISESPVIKRHLRDIPSCLLPSGCTEDSTTSTPDRLVATCPASALMPDPNNDNTTWLMSTCNRSLHLTIECTIASSYHLDDSWIVHAVTSVVMLSSASCCPLLENHSLPNLHTLEFHCLPYPSMAKNYDTSSLQTLSMYNGSGASWVQVLETLPHTPQIQSLTLSGMEFDPRSVDKMAALRSLTVIGASAQSDHILRIYAPLLTELHIEDSYLGYVHDQSFENIPMLTNLLLLGSRITSLGPKSLQSLTMLRTLSLAGNTLTHLDAETFTGLPNLDTLDMHDNSLQAIPTTLLAHLTQLSNLNLATNQLSTLDLPQNSLQTLILSHNWLSVLPGNIHSTASTLETLQLDSNRITCVDDDAFQGMSRLTLVDLSRNRLAKLPDGILAPCTSLTSLHLEHNRITQLPPKLLHSATALTELDVNSNPLHSVHADTFKANRRLEHLYLYNNGLTALDPNLFATLSAMRVISIARNRLSSLPPNLLASMTALNDLIASYNRLTSLPSALLHRCTDIYHIYLDNNRLTELPADLFKTSSHLGTLILNNNRLSQLPNRIFDTTPRMYSLDFSINSLSVLAPDAFAKVPRLLHLELADNLLSALPAGLFSGFTRLVRLDLSNATNSKHFHSPAHIDLPFHIQELYLSGTEINEATLKQLQLLPYLTEARFGYNGICQQSQHLSTVFVNQHLTSISISQTDCSSIAVTWVTGTGVLRIKNNHQLTRLQIQANQLDVLDVGGNERLAQLSPVSVERLAISSTSLPYSSLYCRMMGSDHFEATGLRMPDLYAPHLEDLLSACFQTQSLLDLSGNSFLSNLTLLQNTLGAPFLVGSELHMPYLIEPDGSWTYLSKLEQYPAIVLQDLPITCVLQAYVTKIYSGSGLPGLVNRYQCQCVRGYEKNGDICRKKLGFFDHPWAVPLVVFFSILAISPFILYFVRYMRRRYRHVRGDLELQRHLLDDANVELEVLRKAWEINPAELELKKKLAEGASGTVWKAQWETIQVCVKVLKTNIMLMDQSAVNEFEREVEFLQRTRHGNVVRFFGAGTFGPARGNAPFLVLELVASGSLQTFLEEHRDISWEQKRVFSVDIAQAMAFMHSLGHMHRDLKTGNCLVTQHGNIKVTDFGSIAKNLQQTVDSASLDKAVSDTDVSNSSLTSGVGTPLYMAPEIIRGDSYNASADVFSFGCVLWEIAAQLDPDVVRENKTKISPRGPYLSQILKVWEGGATLVPREDWPRIYQELIPQCLRLQADLRPSFQDLSAAFANGFN
eukprot:m.218775 g.218775  ORF g.218775 m.218775 type:complete len:1327 (-) comp17224_c0_seq1:9-3989(-)